MALAEGLASGVGRTIINVPTNNTISQLVEPWISEKSGRQKPTLKVYHMVCQLIQGYLEFTLYN